MEKTKEELLHLISDLETVIDNLPFDVWLKDTDGNYLVVNKNFEESTGKSKKEIIGMNAYSIFPKAEAKIYAARDRAAINGEEEGYYEEECRNGRYEESFRKPVFNESGDIAGIFGFSKDITLRKKTQDALIESERSKAVLLSNLPGVAYRSSNDSSLTMTFISEGCYDLTGYTAEELIGQNPSYYDLIHKEYLESLLKKWDENAPLNIISPDEYPITTATGETKWVWEQSQEVYDAKENLIATEGFITDVTERKVAEEALKESEEQFRTIFEEAPLGMGIFDLTGEKAYQVNNRLAEIIGRTKEEILSMSWKNYSHPDEINENSDKLKLIGKHKLSGFSMNKRFKKPDGSIVWVNMTIAPFKYGGSSTDCLLCMFEDISERKRADEEILYLSYHDQLTGLYNRRFYEEELQRLDTKRNLPLTLIMGDINGLKILNDSFGHIAGDELIKKVADVIKKGCRSDEIIARIGGDEFVILLPKTDSLETEQIIKRINELSLNEMVGSIPVSISFGYETKNNHKEDIEEIFKKAEAKMYKKKLSKIIVLESNMGDSIDSSNFKMSKRRELHSNKIIELCESMGEALELPEHKIMELKAVGLLHDIGKISVEKNILDKKGELTDYEWQEIRNHPEMGYRMLKASENTFDIAGDVLAHHERWDGKGYPNGLKGKEIPLAARIIAILEAYDAMTSDRCYRDALSIEEALIELQNNAGTQFDAELVNVFIEKMLFEYGGLQASTFVKLEA